MDTRLTPCVFSTASLGVLALVLPGVSAVSDYVPVIASGAVALFLLLILIVVIVFASCYAQTWIKSSMRNDGKVKMPRSYFAKKKEVKRRLLAESVKSSSRMTHDTYVTPLPKSASGPQQPMVNGNIVPPAMPPMDKETLVEGWNQNTRRIYEEKGYTLQMGDEHEEEFHIETTIVDNEVLDVGPYRNLGQSSSARPVDGNVYNNPYLYTNNDRNTPFTVIKSSDETGVVSANSTGITNYGNTYNAIDDKIIKL